MEKREAAWLLYDGDCRICAAFARLVDVVDVKGRVSVRPLQEAQDLLPSVPGDEILDAMRFVAPGGSVTAAHDALIALLATLLDGETLEHLLRRSRLVLCSARQLYAVLVELRGHLICRMPPARTAPLAR